MSDDPEDPSLIALAAALADGSAIDWEALERQDLPPDRRLLVEDLRRVASVVTAHRSEDTRPEPVPEASPAGAFVPRHWRHLVLFECVGTGACGAVYRGWDSQVDREVAVKLLPKSSDEADSPLEEARALARIRHPNVVVIYGADQDDEQVGIWMEYIEGQTLADIVRQRGPMSAREVSGVGVDLCRALSALHAAALLHRDVKAQNVMREVGGRIVLMDFSGAEGVAPRARPTFSGTPVYMAPELFEGAAAGVTADVYSLGVLLFFLISGRFPVDGSSIAEVRTAHAHRHRILLRDVRPDVGDAIVQVIERATAHEPALRYQTAGELEHALAAASGAHAVFVPKGEGGLAPAAPHQRSTSIGLARQLLIAGMMLLVAVAVTADRWWRPPSVSAPLARFTVGPPYLTGSWPRLSPDGRLIVFGAFIEGRNRFWIRPIDANDGRALQNTVATESPFWSPDSRFLAFFADGRLRKVSLTGEVSEIAADAPHPNGGDWNEAGTILFAREGGIYTVAADGGDLSRLTEPDRSRGDYQHIWPEFLPDGQRFLYIVRSSQPERAGLYVGSLASPDGRRLMPAHSRAAYADGHVLFVREGALVAQPFDVRTATIHGEPVVLAGDVHFHAASDAAFDVSSSGVLIYWNTPTPATTRLVLKDRRGRDMDVLHTLGSLRQPQFSPNGRRIVVEGPPDDGRGSDLWVYDIGRRSASRLTRSDAEDVRPVWSPDGSRVAFSSKRGPLFQIFTKMVDGTGEERLLETIPGDKLVESWSPDGKYLSVTIRRSGLWIIPLAPGTEPWCVRTDAATEVWQSEFSPDGRWLAYVSAESGHHEVYVEPFPATGARWQVSTNGGTEPHWRGDARELFYLSAGGELMSLPIGPGAWQSAKPTPLFRVSVRELAGPTDYDVSPDGTRFIVNTLVSDSVIPPLNVVLNWAGLLTR